MSAELIAILAVAVAGVVLNGQRIARQDIKELRQEMKQDIGELRTDLDGRMRAVEHSQAKLEGLLEGLREAIAGRRDAA